MFTVRRIGFAFFLMTLSLLFQVTYADPPLPIPVARVVWIKGVLKAEQPNKEERTLVKMSVIYLHDTLTTDDKTRAEIVFTDNTLLTFYPSSKIFIDQYAYKLKPKNGSAGTQVTNLIEGGFRTITGVIAKTNNKDYQVNSPVATIGVRGTDYAIRLQKGHLYVAWYAGKPCVTNKPAAANKSTATSTPAETSKSAPGNEPNKQAPKELCLDSTTRYAEVAGAGFPPIPLSQMPDAFDEKLEVDPAKISPFGIPQTINKTGGGGVVTSFCIM